MAAEALKTYEPLLRALIASKLSDEATLNALVQDAQRGDKPLLAYAAEKKVLSEREVMVAFCQRYGVPMLNLEAVQVDQDTTHLVSHEIMQRYQIFPLAKRGKVLEVALANPTDYKALEELAFHTGLQIHPVLVEAVKLYRLITQTTENVHERMENIFAGQNAVEDVEDDAVLDLSRDAPGGQAGVDDAPVVRFVQQLLFNAIQREVSDIHFEPYEQEIRIRYRLDGVLQDMMRNVPMAMRDGVTSRFKVLCRLDISEHRLPQDGRLRVRMPPNRIIDFRVSFRPTAFGETIVLRLLDPANSKVPIEQLGFLPAQRKLFEDAIRRPYGMILVTGPTGSGKTTTLYTALNMLNTGDVNISTAEDPVEIPVFGINQVNVNERIGLTFAAALRSFLRQDPDILMVGEVRDLETAETALKAAQTGHLVLATLHTNDAPQSLTRLENMGIPAYSVAGAVHLVMAQRLARKLCDHCKEPLHIPEQALREAGYAPEDLSGWRPMGPKGCDKCHQTGYRGRVGLYQVMPVSDAMRETILRGGTSLDLARQSAAEGIMTMRQAGLQRVQEGITSLAEILRVTNL